MATISNDPQIKPITIYTATICPYSQRARIVLNEVKATAGNTWKEVQIDLDNKPDWYKDVNPALRVPAIKYGDESLDESLIIMEFFAELYSAHSNILPKDPMARARCRYFINAFDLKFNSLFTKLTREFPPETDEDQARVANLVKDLNAGILYLTTLLQKQSEAGPYFLGSEFSIADATAAPFVARLNSLLDVEWLKTYSWPNDKDFDRFKQWAKAIASRKSVRETLPMTIDVVTHYTKLRNRANGIV